MTQLFGDIRVLTYTATGFVPRRVPASSFSAAQFTKGNLGHTPVIITGALDEWVKALSLENLDETIGHLKYTLHFNNASNAGLLPPVSRPLSDLPLCRVSHMNHFALSERCSMWDMLPTCRLTHYTTDVSLTGQQVPISFCPIQTSSLRLSHSSSFYIRLKRAGNAPTTRPTTSGEQPTHSAYPHTSSLPTVPTRTLCFTTPDNPWAACTRISLDLGSLH